MKPDLTVKIIQSYIKQSLIEVAHIDSDHINEDIAFDSYNLDSMTLTYLQADIEERLQGATRIEMDELFQHNTISKLAIYLHNKIQSR